MYLDCWCQETVKDTKQPELKHNRSLRLDRIEEIIIKPEPSEWRGSLDNIEIEMHLLNGLVNGYKSKSNVDVVNQILSGSPVKRQVVRKVSNTFWFFREILRYGEECIIVSPESVRNRFREKVEKLWKNYKQ